VSAGAVLNDELKIVLTFLLVHYLVVGKTADTLENILAVNLARCIVIGSSHVAVGQAFVDCAEIVRSGRRAAVGLPSSQQAKVP
jgi:hypothetical protein